MPLLGSRGAASLTGFGGLAKLGYLLRNSLRFRASATAYLSRTPGSASNRRTYTWSGWVKRGALSYGEATLFNAGTTGIGSNDTGFLGIRFTSGDKLDITTGNTDLRNTTQVFRDPAAWYHIVVAFDTTQATGANRVKVYINGTQVTDYAGTDPTQNLDTAVNNNVLHEVGRTSWNSAGYFDGYIAEQNFIDGLQLTPSSFGKTDPVTGQWIPIKFGGAYGTNGFYLNFNDTSAVTAAALGKDSSGNGNNWTPTNISLTAGVTYDAMTDVPTLTSATVANYATLNPLDKFTSLPAPTNGNLSQANGSAAWYNIRSTIGVTSGKWYAEVTQSGSNLFAGVMSGSSARNFTSYTDASGLYAFFNNGAGTTGYKYANGTSGSSFTIADNDVIGLAYDYDAQTLAIYRNGNLQDTVTSIPKTETMFFCASFAQTTASTVWNFGQRPFAYTPPAGFKSLNTFNI
jgi:hypothetical protein